MQLEPKGLHVSIPYLRDLESGESVPGLRLAVAIEDVTAGRVTTREWVGLSKRPSRRTKRRK